MVKRIEGVFPNKVKKKKKSIKLTSHKDEIKSSTHTSKKKKKKSFLRYQLL